jgi:hypothetical protein
VQRRPDERARRRSKKSRSALLLFEDTARLVCAGRIDRGVSFLNVPNDSFFIDHEGGTISKALLLNKDSIVFHHSAFEIAEDRKSNSKLFCKFTIGGNTVYTHSEYLGFGCFEFGDISLIRLQFLRSTTGECEYIHRQHHILLAFEVAQLVSISIGRA